MTMKQWAINCLACYGAYCLVRDYLEENYGIEIVVHKKNEVKDAEVVEPKKKKWAVTFSR